MLLAFDPWRRYELHPDHLAAGRAAVDARIAAKMPLFYPELQAKRMSAWAISEMWMFNADAPNYFVDVSDTLELQRRALQQHASQTTIWDESVCVSIEKLARTEAFHRIVMEGALVGAEGMR